MRMRMRKKRNILKSKRAESYIDMVVGIFAALMVVVTALNVFSLLKDKQDLDYYAKEMIEVCCSYGKTCDEVQDRDEALQAELGFNPELSFAGTEYFNTNSRTVQYGETIVVTLTYRTYLKGFGAIRIPVTLTARHSGLSRQYWK